jgi:hypothetical protein
MAQKKPKVGDRAIIDGVELTVTAVEPGGKAKVVLGDEEAVGRAATVAAVRAQAAKKGAELDAAFEVAMAEPDKIKRRAATTPLKVELAAHNNATAAALAEVPRGTTVGVALKDVEFVEAADAWSVRGRLLSYADRKNQGR